MGINAVHVFHFEPIDCGTLARSAESFRGLIPSVFKKYSRKVLKAGIDGILRALKIEAERQAASRTGWSLSRSYPSTTPCRSARR
jgi:hypothetical protein